jgi:hypothetical protein
MRTLVLQHPALRLCRGKWLAVAVGSATATFGGLMHQAVRGDTDLLWPWLATLLLPPAMFVALAADRRAREFVLGLPVPAARVWAAHGVALVLAGAVVIATGLGLITVGCAILADIDPRPDAPVDRVLRGLAQLWIHLPAWLLLLAGVAMLHRPSLVRAPRSGRRTIGDVAVALAAAAGLAAAGSSGPASVVAVLAAAGALWLAAWRRRPGAYVLAPRAADAARPVRRSGDGAPAAAPWSWRRPLWIVVYLVSGDHLPVRLITLPILFGFGMAISNLPGASAADAHLGLLLIPMTAYMVVAVAGGAAPHLWQIDHLPLSRRRLMAMVIMTPVLIMAAGYAAGEITVSLRGATGQPLTFSDADDTYGVRLWPRYFAIDRDGPPAQIAPGGEMIAPPDCCPDRHAWLGRLGLTMYKPYHTPRGATLETCAWQLERASARVFGTAIPAATFAERYLVVDAEGVVRLRDGGMDLRADFPDLRPRLSPGLVPLQTAAAGLLALSVLWWYFGFLRPGVTERRRKTAFGASLGVLMVLHMMPFALAIAGVVSPDDLTTVAMIGSDRLVAALPGGLATLWALALALVAGPYLLVQRRFDRAEWPRMRSAED